MQPVLRRVFNSHRPYGRNLAGTNIDQVVAAGRELLDEQPRSRAELGPLLAKKWPEHDPASLAQAVTYLLPVVQIPPRGIWGKSGRATWATAEQWLGRPLKTNASRNSAVKRYLASFGPASVADIRAWSALTGVAEIIEKLRPQLRAFRGPTGAELFDLSDSEKTDDDTPPPPRFLPFYENALLSYADRSRMIPAEHGRRISMACVLIRGFVRAQWKIERQRRNAVLLIEPFEKLSKKEASAVTKEGGRLLSFAAADAEKHDVQLITAK
jgi:hypothetical protein